MKKLAKLYLIKKKYLRIIRSIKSYFIERKYLIVIGIIIPIIIAVSLFVNFDVEEISNNVTLVVEIGVGVVIAVTVYGISRRSETQIENKVNELFDIIRKRESFKKKQERDIDVFLLNVFREIQTSIEVIYGNSDLYENSSDLIQKEFYKKKIITECHKIKHHAEENLDNSSIISPEFFDIATIRKFKDLSALCKNEPVFSQKGDDVKIDFCNTIENIINPLTDDFHQKITKKSEMISRVKLESKTDILSITVSSDRTVYPLDSNMHIQANLPSIIHGEKILFEFFNSDRNLILSREIDLEKYGQLKMDGPCMVECSFKMQGSEWRIDEEYIVRATYASSYSEDSFFIDQRMPALQSDKSVYMINSDIIITIIDPDADKDNDVAEFAGDREDSKLTIETPYGKIDGYRLTETGKSTGIFQGIIGVLGIRKDGSVIEHNVDGKIINKIQGTRLDDGFIGGPPGQEIIASYKNNTGTVYLTMFISNFGAAVEMDQKTYSQGDKVYLTIVAPDFNFDSDSIDEIGAKSESSITIRTSKDEILNYRLIETGPDTGIFTGELLLVKSEKNKQINHGFGPNDGQIVCDNDDVIEVTFSLFGFEDIIGKATIKS